MFAERCLCRWEEQCADNMLSYYEKDNLLYALCLEIKSVEDEYIISDLWIVKITLRDGKVVKEKTYHKPAYKSLLNEVSHKKGMDIPEMAECIKDATKVEFLHICDYSLFEEYEPSKKKMVSTHEKMIIDAYKNALLNHGTDIDIYETATGETMSSISYSKYGVYDIDKDNIPEMIVYDASEHDWYIYSFKNAELSCWKEYIGAYSSDSFYEYPNGNGILIHGGGMGRDHFEYVTRHNFENGGLVYVETVGDGYTLTGSVDTLRESLTGYKKIVFKETNDLALLDNLSVIDVNLNGGSVNFDVLPIMVNNRVMTPIGSILEALGYEIEWDGNIQTVTADRGNDQIIIQINNRMIHFTRNDFMRCYECDVAPQIIFGRTMVPVRAVAEIAGCDVRWDGENTRVIITPDSND